MNKYIQLVVMVSVFSGAGFSAAQAADKATVSGGTLQFMGSVVDAPCAVNADSENGIIHLDQVTLESIGEKGEASGQAKSFNIVLDGCDVTTYANATITFNGQSTPALAGALANTAGAGAAKGIALELFGPDGNALDLGADSSKQVLATGTNKIPMSVDYVKTGDKMTSGSVEAIATFQITYF